MIDMDLEYVYYLNGLLNFSQDYFYYGWIITFEFFRKLAAKISEINEDKKILC